jgi:beta-lactamase regulating signal transducer with metallopeptidase domain
MSDAGTLFSLSTLSALALSHLWQSVAVAATLAGILILGRRMSGAARYGLACAAMAAAIVLPLAMFAPGAGARAMLLSWLKAPPAMSAPLITAETKPATPVAQPASDFGLDIAQAALSTTRTTIASNAPDQPEAGIGLGIAQFAINAARNDAATKPAERVSERTWGKPIAAAPKAASKPWFSDLKLPTLPKLPDLSLPFLIVWLAGSLTLLVRVARDFLAAERLVKRARTIPLPVELAQRLGRVRLAISPEAPGPMAAGLFQPSVILPEAAIQRIGTAEMAALLEHELAHIERRDVLAALAQRIVIALLWWSPALYWISRRIDEERESACDETAVARTGDARAFARSLTSQAETQLWARAPKLAVGAIGRRSQFGRRIRRLVEMAKAGGVPAHYSGRLAFTGLALAIALAAFITPKLALADVPKAPPTTGKAATDADKGKPLPLVPAQTPAPTSNDRKFDGAAAKDAVDDSDDVGDVNDNSDADDAVDVDTIHASIDLGLKIASLGANIGALVGQQVSENVPVILDQVRAELEAEGIQVDDLNDLSDADRERLRADMQRLRDRLKTEFGPEFREKIQREVERATRDAERARHDAERDGAHWAQVGEKERRKALATAQDAIVKAQAEIEAARKRGDFNFAFDASQFAKFKDFKIDDDGKHRQIVIKLDGNPSERQLMEAAYAGDVSRVRQLIKDGANPDRGFPGDGSPLIAAARRNRADVIRVLLDAGADVDKGVPGDGNALIAAAQRGSVDAARILINRNADVDAYIPGDETPLIAAAANGELAIVKLLVEHHADVNRAYRVMGRLRSPLGMAQSHGYDDVAAYLRAHGAVADPKAAN